MVNLAMITYAMPPLLGGAPYNQWLNISSFWTMTTGVGVMSAALTFAGVLQTHLERVLGQDYMEVQQQLTLFYWILPLDRTGETLVAPPNFMLAASYNPGYQNLLKSLKPSTRQRLVALEFAYPAEEAEVAIDAAESGLAPQRCCPLILLAHRLRGAKRRRSRRRLLDAPRCLCGNADCRRDAHRGCGASGDDRAADR